MDRNRLLINKMNKNKWVNRVIRNKHKILVDLKFYQIQYIIRLFQGF